MATNKQTRWMCGGCKREWQYARVFIIGNGNRKWEEGEPCPTCGYHTVNKCEYVPEFAGADVPRDGSNVVMTVAVPQTIIPEDDPRTIRKENHTLAMSMGGAQ